MKYILVEENSIETLMESVNKLITDGWKPLGGVSHSKNPDLRGNISYCQALVKE